MKLSLVVVGALPIIVLQASHGSGAAQSQLSDLSPMPAAKYITDAFDRYPLVAFSEPRHGAWGTKKFLASLIRQPGFEEKVDDIVVEFGNSRYQDVVDRYIAGEPVAHDQLKQAWENTTVATGVWMAPMYEGVLREIRAVNRSLPPSRRIRVLPAILCGRGAWGGVSDSGSSVNLGGGRPASSVSLSSKTGWRGRGSVRRPARRVPPSRSSRTVWYLSSCVGSPVSAWSAARA